ncbi:Glypican-5 [Camelus dromedarius]|uniref:Glypican-5 n=1 Tax=Camelus dromedarius TaxID=9838 RepID=A0A5N4D996_CAMDR|nr:Glypican-5 [Camelus dromedarius]
MDWESERGPALTAAPRVRPQAARLGVVAWAWPDRGRGGGGGGACVWNATRGRVQVGSFEPKPAATAAVARVGAHGLRVAPVVSLARAAPETRRRSARELWCFSLVAPPEKASPRASGLPPAARSHLLEPRPPSLLQRLQRRARGERVTRTPMMDAQTWRVGCRCLLLLALVGFTRSEGMQSCEEVRKLFQGLPDSPRAGKARMVGSGLCAWARAGTSRAPALRSPGSEDGLSDDFLAPLAAQVNPGEANGEVRCGHPERSAAPGTLTMPAAEPRSGLSADALVEASKADSWAQRGLHRVSVPSGNFPSAPPEGLGLLLSRTVDGEIAPQCPGTKPSFSGTRTAQYVSSLHPLNIRRLHCLHHQSASCVQRGEGRVWGGLGIHTLWLVATVTR